MAESEVPRMTDDPLEQSGPKSAEGQTQEDVHEAGILGTAVNMACNIMGGAVLVLPTAMDDASLVPGLILILGLGLMSLTTMVMLAHSAEKLKVYNYRSLLAATTYPICGRLFEVALFLYTYGVLIEYGRVISDSIPDAARDFFHVDSGVLVHGWFWLLIACVPFVVFTAMPRLTELKWTSIIGFFTIFYIQIMIVMRYADGTYRDGRTSYNAPDVKVASLSMNVFRAIPVLAVAFSCHYNVPFYYRELKVRTVQQFYKVLLVVHPALVTAYVLTGLLGYLTFGSAGLANTTGNVVNAYRNTDVPVNIGRVGLFFHFCTAFPIVAIGCRNCLNGILFHTPDRSQVTYIVESVALVSTSAILAWEVPGIAFVVDIIGSLFGVAIVFIIPSVVYIQSNRRFPDHTQTEPCIGFDDREGGGAASTGASMNTFQGTDGGDSSASRFFKGMSSRLFGSTNADAGSSAASQSEASPKVSSTPLLAAGNVAASPMHHVTYRPPPSWVVRKHKLLYVVAHGYIVLGVAGAVISFAVTLDKVIKGQS
jgi:amino acid permease